MSIVVRAAPARTETTNVDAAVLMLLWGVLAMLLFFTGYGLWRAWKYLRQGGR
jgi:hypothetical protein